MVEANLNIHFMNLALELAKKAYDENEVPIGAVIVSSEGKILGQGHNMTEQSKSQLAHAEVLAIKQAAMAVDDWRLEGASIYVNLAPCMMCLGLICLSRINYIFYSIQSPLYGFDVDIYDIPNLYKSALKMIKSGILADESNKLLVSFFKERRKHE